eukprot:3169774-Rhodomonas_salina.1
MCIRDSTHTQARPHVCFQSAATTVCASLSSQIASGPDLSPPRSLPFLPLLLLRKRGALCCDAIVMASVLTVAHDHSLAPCSLLRPGSRSGCVSSTPPVSQTSAPPIRP